MRRIGTEVSGIVITLLRLCSPSLRVRDAGLVIM